MTTIRDATIRDATAAAGILPRDLDAMPHGLAVAYEQFADWPLDSHCGRECLAILDAAGPLLDRVDPLARPDIRRGVVRAMAVVCLG